MADQLIKINEALVEVELLGRDADVIAQDIHDIIEIVVSWGNLKLLPGALVPVVLDAVDRALLQQLGYIRTQCNDDNSELFRYIEAQELKINNRIVAREAKKPMEAVA